MFNNEDAGDLQAMHTADASEISFMDQVGEVLAFIICEENKKKHIGVEPSYRCWQEVKEEHISEEVESQWFEDSVYVEALSIARM